MSCTVRSVILLAAVFQTSAMTVKKGNGMLRGITASVGKAPVVLSAANSCAALKNQGTFFSVPISVGTPEPGTEAQVLEVVADTGSNSIVVTSCACVDSGFCGRHDNCFRGTNRSTTFLLSGEANSALGLSLTYGSGTVQTVIASDKVEVGGKSVLMQDGVLLMIDRRRLRISGSFEGILGLGPKRTEAKNMLEDNGGMSVMDNQNQTLPPDPGSGTHPGSGSPPDEPKRGQSYEPKLFMEKAGIDRYSLCFNDAGKPGALRMDVPPLTDALPAIGSFHWGLGLYGLSVGSGDAAPLICDSSTMVPNQTTPCAAIPDSGTTLMLGPKDQVKKLFGSLCDAWPRCQQEHSSGSLKNFSSAHAFQKLLYDCDSWLSDEKGGINEVPSIFLNMGGQGQTKVIELSAWSYITETMANEYIHVTKHLFGVIPVDISVPTGSTKKVCAPSFGVQKYNTRANGPVWIMGTPLFYEFVVNYDLTGPSISFSDEPCAACNETAPAFLSSREQVQQSTSHRARPMRKTFGPPRVPIRDTALPL